MNQKFLLDTNVLSELMPDGKKKSKLINASDKLFSEDFADRIFSFDNKSAVMYATIVSHRIHSGHPITTEDAQIASIAISNNLFLLTRNEKDFLWIDNLSVVNPWDFDISKKQ